MKRTLSLVLAFVMLICSFAAVSSAEAKTKTKAPAIVKISYANFYYDMLRKSCHITVKWKTQKSISGYQVKLGIEEGKKVSYVKTKTVKGAKKNILKVYCDYKDDKSFYTVAKVRAYKTKKGKKIYGKWSKQEFADFKVINELTGFKGKVLAHDDSNDYTLKLKLNWKEVKGADGYQIVYRNVHNYYSTSRVYVEKKNYYTGWFKEVGQVTIRPYRLIKGKREYGEFSTDFLDFSPDL